jgi:hypothetical protein
MPGTAGCQLAGLAGLSALLLLSTLICGLWLRFSGRPVEQSSLDFHLWIAVSSVGATVITLALALANCWKQLCWPGCGERSLGHTTPSARRHSRRRGSATSVDVGRKSR